MYDNLTYVEFIGWTQYFFQNPPHQDRSEIQLARLSHLAASFAGGKNINFYDYTVTLKDPKKKNDDSNFYVDKQGRKIMKSSKGIDKILDKKMKS